MSSSRENSVYLAKLAEQAERYEGNTLNPSRPIRPLPRDTAPPFSVRGLTSSDRDG